MTQGGGVLTRENLSMSDCTVTGNSTFLYTGKGGGIYGGSQTVTITRCTISNNWVTESRGGGIAILSHGHLTVNDSTISGNFANNGGGGIYSRQGVVLVTDSVINDNSALGPYSAAIVQRSLNGGYGQTTLESCTISGNVGDGLYACLAYDYAITQNTSTGIVLGRATNCLISQNGGDGANRTGVAYCTISGNAGDGVSGGFTGFFPIVVNSTISGNGGDGVSDATTLLGPTIVNSTISGNTGHGVSSGGRLSVVGSTIDHNGAGGIYLQGGLVEVTDSTISDNIGTNGGGIFVRFHTPSDLYSSPPSPPTPPMNVTITNSTITGNYASRYGGGLFFAFSGPHHPVVQIRHSTITGNTAAGQNMTYHGGDGGGMYVSEGIPELDHALIAGNHAARSPDVQAQNGSGFIIARFSLIGTNSGTFLAEAPLGAPDADGNLIGGPVFGDIDPLLGPLVDNGGPVLPDGTHPKTMALLPGSPAIDAGDPAAVAGVGTVPQYDQRDAPFGRIVGERIDMGALETQANPLPGDYNYNGIVDTADYTIWQDTRGSAVDFRADGDGNGIIDEADYDVWRDNFGATLPIAGAGAALRSESTGFAVANSEVEAASPATAVRALDPSPVQQHVAGLLLATVSPARPTVPATTVAVNFAARDVGLLLWLNAEWEGQQLGGAATSAAISRRPSLATSDKDCARDSDTTDHAFDSLAFSATIE